MEKNLTTGSVFKTILYFALPYLFSYFLQTLYGMADLFIIGQFNGTESTTAVANGSQVMHMLTVMIVGLAMGSTVIIGRAVGARHKDEIAKTVGNSVTLFMGLSIVLTIVLLLLVRPIVLLIQTPVEAIEGSIRYLTIANVCEKVYLIHRRDELRGAKVLQQRIFDAANIEFLPLWFFIWFVFIIDRTITEITSVNT